MNERLRATAWRMKSGRRLTHSWAPRGSGDSPRVEYSPARGDHGPLMQLATQIAGVFGFLGVALGAFGAHQLASLLAANQTAAIWQTAVLYHLVHSVAALWAASRNPTVVWIWAAGILVFSGSLYILALTNIRWLGAITPIGGLLFLAGWLLVAIRSQ